jgi:hypothetical protein
MDMIIFDVHLQDLYILPRIDRLFYAQGPQITPDITESYLREKEKKEEAHIKASHPGDLFCQDTFYVGTIKDLGRIYQQTGTDAYANFGFTKIYTNKKA